MSKTREQLEAAKTAYTSVKYPGDLATDVRRREGFSAWRLLMPLAPFAAIAAVIALVIMMVPRPPTVHIGPVVVNPVTPTVEIAESLVPAAQTMPSDVATAMPAETFAVPASMSVPSMPSIPSWSVSTDVSLDESNQG